MNSTRYGNIVRNANAGEYPKLTGFLVGFTSTEVRQGDGVASTCLFLVLVRWRRHGSRLRNEKQSRSAIQMNVLTVRSDHGPFVPFRRICLQL